MGAGRQQAIPAGTDVEFMLNFLELGTWDGHARRGGLSHALSLRPGSGGSTRRSIILHSPFFLLPSLAGKGAGGGDGAVYSSRNPSSLVAD